MKTLDRYIIRQFVVNFAILYVVLMTLFVVVDLIVNLDEFLKGGYNWAQRQTVAQSAENIGQPVSTVLELIQRDAEPKQIAERLRITETQARTVLREAEPGQLLRVIGVVRTIADFYGPMVILIYAFFSGLIVVAAMGFTLSGLSRSRELTAMTSSGISLYRVAMPILVAGIGLNVLALPVQEFIVPRLADKLSRKKSHVKYQTVRQFAFQYAPDGNGSLISAASFDAEHEQLSEMRVVLRNDDGLQIGHITAAQGAWNESRQGWDLIDGYTVRPGGVGESAVRALDRRHESVDFLATDLSPTLIKTRRSADYIRLLPVAELQKMQHNLAVPASMRTEIARAKWGRLSLLIVNVLILVIGLPYFLLRAPDNMLIQSMKAAAMCIGVWAGGMTIPELTAGTLNPVAAAWFPVVIYLPLSAYILQTVKT
jgi:lipopolysaccharide export system permease protein